MRFKFWERLSFRITFFLIYFSVFVFAIFWILNSLGYKNSNLKLYLIILGVLYTAIGGYLSRKYRFEAIVFFPPDRIPNELDFPIGLFGGRRITELNQEMYENDQRHVRLFEDIRKVHLSIWTKTGASLMLIGPVCIIFGNFLPDFSPHIRYLFGFETIAFSAVIIILGLYIFKKFLWLNSEPEVEKLLRWEWFESKS